MDRIKKSLLVLFILTNVLIFSSCAKKYTINFVVDDDVISTTIVKRGDKISIPTDPLKEGYTFIEWQLNNERYNFSTAVKEDKELKAKFEINKYNVVFDSNGGSSVAKQTVKYKDKITYPNIPIKEGYNFGYWQDLDGNIFNFENPITSNITLIAKWISNEVVKYKVTLDLNGGTFVERTELINFDVEEGTVLSLSTPYKEGYKFVGWMDESGEEYTFSPITSNLNLVAKWENEVYRPTWSYNKQTNNWHGSGMDVKILVEKTSEVDPFDQNYTFSNKFLKQKQQRLLEAAYDIVIKYEAYPDKASWGRNRMNYIQYEYASESLKNNDIYIVNISSSWIPNMIKYDCLAELGTISSNGTLDGGILTEIGYSKKEENSKEFIEGLYNIDPIKNQMLSNNGKVYGYTVNNIHPDYFLYYNADLIASVGMVDPAELWLKGEWNWNNFVQYCNDLQNALTKKYEIGYWTLATGFAELAIGSVAAEGSYLIDSSNRITLTSQNVIGKLNQIRSLYESSVYYPNRGTEDVSVAFEAGQAAITSGSLWFLNNENRFDNDLGFEIGAVPYPTADGKGGVPIATNDLEDAILDYNGNPIETNNGSGIYISGVDMSESTFNVPVTDISCYSIVNTKEGKNGINNKILFAILYDLTANIIDNSPVDETNYQVADETDEDYREWLKTKFNRDLYVEVIMSVQDKWYYDKIEVVNQIVTSGTDIHNRNFWSIVEKICKNANVSINEELNSLLSHYKDVLIPNYVIE